MKANRKTAGDTIVEVLIAMAVVSSVLGGAYVVVNRTMANTRQAQEHSEALQLANRQVESIVYWSNQNPGLIYNSTVHCAASTDGSIVNFSPAVSSLPAAEGDYPALCVSGSVNYRAGFKYNQVSKVFTVFVTWPSATGNGNDQVSVAYKAFRP